MATGWTCGDSALAIAIETLPTGPIDSRFPPAKPRAITTPPNCCGTPPPLARLPSSFGCAGPHLRARRGASRSSAREDLAVVGIVEVLAHLPRIWRASANSSPPRRARKARSRHPDRLPRLPLPRRRKLKRLGIPVVYLVAPQVWAWRKGRVKTMRRIIDRLLCIFPFEEAFFREHGVPVDLYRPSPGLAGEARRSPGMSFSGNTTFPRTVHWWQCSPAAAAAKPFATCPR